MSRLDRFHGKAFVIGLSLLIFKVSVQQQNRHDKVMDHVVIADQQGRGLNVLTFWNGPGRQLRSWIGAVLIGLSMLTQQLHRGRLHGMRISNLDNDPVRKATLESDNVRISTHMSKVPIQHFRSRCKSITWRFM